jgi:hypothetical protein
MIFNIELPFSLKKYQDREPDPDPGGQKKRIRLHIFFLYWYFIPLFVRLRFYVNTFRKNFREKLTKFRENCDTFPKNFRFRERSIKCFRPNPNADVDYS